MPKLSPPRLYAPDERDRGSMPTPFVSTWDDLPRDEPRKRITPPGMRVAVALLALGATLLGTVVPF